MAEELKRNLLVKDLENSKLRQRIKELEDESYRIQSKCTEQLFTLLKENDNLKQVNREFEFSTEILNQSLVETNTKFYNAEQTQYEIKNKIQLLQENNQKLIEDLVDARRSQCTAEEEVVMVSERNYQLTYELKNLQQENEKRKTELSEILMKTDKKEHDSQTVFEDFNKIKQQNIKLQEEFANVSASLKEIKSEMRRKDLKITQMTINLEEFTKTLQQQEVLEKEIQKLQAENVRLQLESKTSDTNRNNLAKILLKNKELLAENKKLGTENKRLQNENLRSDNNLIQDKQNIGAMNITLETAQREISGLKIKNSTLETNLREVSLALDDKEQLFNQKRDLEEENWLLKKKAETDEAEIVKANQSRLILLDENCELKQKIENLENSNFQKIKIIAKLKAVSDQFVCIS